VRRAERARTPSGWLERVFAGSRGVAVAATAGMAVMAFGAVAVGPLRGAPGGFANSAYDVGSGPVQLSENVGSATCVSTGDSSLASGVGSHRADCTNIDDFGAKIDQSPGGPASRTVVRLTNTGSVSTSVATLVTGQCTATAARNGGEFSGSDTAGYCAEVDVTIANHTPGAPDKCVFPAMTAAACSAPSDRGTLASLNNRTLTSPALSPLAAGASATYVITLQLAPSATNADQGLAASLPLTWSVGE
jgi:hypothetical protein